RARVRRPAARAGLPRGELREVGDADQLLQRGDLLDRLLEALLAENLVLALLEQIPEPVVLLLADQLVEGREQLGVLARLVGAVHADEGADGRTGLGPVAAAAQDLRGQGAPGPVLLAQGPRQRSQPAGLLEAGEDLLLLDLLVVLLDEAAHEIGGA